MPRKDSLFFHKNNKKKMGRPEEIVQRACVTLLQTIENLTRRLSFFHIPNQLLRTMVLRVVYAALGVRAGVPDLVILMEGGRIIFVELKINPNKTNVPPKHLTSSDQDDFHAILIRLGFTVYVLAARNTVDAQNQLLVILEEQGFDHGINLV